MFKSRISPIVFKSNLKEKYLDADVIKMLEYLIDGYFSKQSAYRWVLTVHRYLPTCFYTRMRRSLYNFIIPPSRQETPRTTIQLHLQIYRWCIVSEKHKICRVFGIHLSTWTWNKGNNGDCSLLLILGLLPLHWHGKLTTRLYDKRDDFNFPIVNFPFLSSNIPSVPFTFHS